MKIHFFKKLNKEQHIWYQGLCISCTFHKLEDFMVAAIDGGQI